MNVTRLKLLGSGGFGNVYLAVLDDSTQVVVKELRDPQPSVIERFKREFRLQSELAHPYIVRVLYHALEAETPWFLLELCERGAAEEWMGSQPSWRAVCRVVADVAVALAHVHTHGGFHRDIKPANILLTETPGRLTGKLSDFGLARMPDPASGPMTTTACGTQGYFAPEVLRDGQHSQRADVYALGLTLRDLLIGSHDRTVPLPNTVPVEVRVLLKQMLADAPEQRPTASQVASRLEAVLVQPTAVPVPEALPISPVPALVTMGPRGPIAIPPVANPWPVLIIFGVAAAGLAALIAMDGGKIPTPAIG